MDMKVTSQESESGERRVSANWNESSYEIVTLDMSESGQKKVTF